MKVALLALFFSSMASAFTFSNDYLQFQLGDDWGCSASGVNWVCEPKDALKKRSYIITVSAKVAGPTDNLEAFQSYLAKSRSHQMGSNTPVMSQILSVTRRQLQNWQWVQGIHLGSEVKDFYTMYMATVKNGLAIMITLSAEKQQWPKAQSAYETVINSIQIKNFAPPKTKNGKPEIIPIPANTQNTPLTQEMNSAPPHKGLPKVYMIGLILAGVILTTAVFIFLKGS